MDEAVFRVVVSYLHAGGRAYDPGHDENAYPAVGKRGLLRDDFRLDYGSPGGGFYEERFGVFAHGFSDNRLAAGGAGERIHHQTDDGFVDLKLEFLGNTGNKNMF